MYGAVIMSHHDHVIATAHSVHMMNVEAIPQTMSKGRFVCGWQVTLCDLTVRHGPYLSATEIRVFI